MQRSIFPSEADILHWLLGNLNAIILRAHILKATLLKRAWMIVSEYQVELRISEKDV
jgi:hypothetical protein